MKISDAFRLKGYRPSKAAQMAAYFAEKEGGKIEKLKLIKLIYLAERESMKRRARPMIYDQMYSLPHGPICSNALNGINGTADKTAWSRWVHLQSDNKTVRSLKAAERKSLKELSESDIEILQSIWARFGHMTSGQIRKWTHDNCPEYIELESGRIPIEYRDVFEAVGHDNAVDLEVTVREYRRIEAALED
jgi:uncharacterized phage-associated protein